ncbi:MAG: formylmethanofuran dehydrogenase subunit C [Methylococcaceae bacterium]
MKPLTLTLKIRPEQRVDMSPLSCHLIKDKTPAEIAAIKLNSGTRKLKVEKLFNIKGQDTQHIIIEQSHPKLDFIGKDLQGGQIKVEGHAGAYLGIGMQSGTIKVTGDAAIFAGCEMKNGLLQIDGNAGDFVGGALPGNKKGIQGGMLLVKGNVGERAGDHMRRGVLLIEGNTGDYCASRMTAGTIAVLGSVGRYLGYGMRRGTLVLWQMPEIGPTFNDCGSHTLAFLPMLFASFRHLNSSFADPSNAFDRVKRYGGDMGEMGRGELLIKA